MPEIVNANIGELWIAKNSFSASIAILISCNKIPNNTDHARNERRPNHTSASPCTDQLNATHSASSANGIIKAENPKPSASMPSVINALR